MVFLYSEDGGFEPPLPCGKHRFQRCAIDHSANLPCLLRILCLSFPKVYIFFYYIETQLQTKKRIVFKRIHKMDYKKLLLAWALFLQPAHNIKEESAAIFQDNLYETLIDETTQEEPQSVYYHLKISKELLQQIDTMDLDSDLPVVFSRTWEDVKDAPFAALGISKHIGEFLWYNQYDYILKKYNNDTIPDSLKTWADFRVDNFELINFPLIYDEFDTIVPHSIDWLFQDEKFAEYRDTIHSSDTLIVLMKQANWQHALFYYKTGKLILATYATIGWGKSTTRWLFHVDFKEDRKKSRRYGNVPMPYALHVIGNVFIHQWKVSPFNHSHGCCRIPWFYAEALSRMVTAPDAWLFYDFYDHKLDSVKTQLYDSLNTRTPKVIIVD